MAINNNFAEIRNIQEYRNPFKKPLEVHYSFPTDPDFCLTRLQVFYPNAVIVGTVKEREVVKAQFKEAKNNGEVTMMAYYSKSETSLMKVGIGNLEVGETIRIEFDMFG